MARHCRLAASLLVTTIVALAACGDKPGSSRFEAGGIQKFDDCLQRVFPLEPTFMATKKRIDSVGIFLQTETRIGPAGDLVYLEVYEPDAVAENQGQTMTFQYPPGRSPPVCIKVAPWGSCPETNVSLAVQGTVRFDRFGVESGDRMIGELVDGTLVDARTCSVDAADERECEVVANSFTGTWDFPVETTAPHRTYPTFDDEYRVDP